jgi:hypothetical protein
MLHGTPFSFCPARLNGSLRLSSGTAPLLFDSTKKHAKNGLNQNYYLFLGTYTDFGR